MVVAVDGMDVGEVNLEVGSVFSTKESVALESVSELSLICPFAVRLCGIRIECGKSVSLVGGESRQVVQIR